MRTAGSQMHRLRCRISVFSAIANEYSSNVITRQSDHGADDFSVKQPRLLLLMQHLSITGRSARAAHPAWQPVVEIAAAEDNTDHNAWSVSPARSSGVPDTRRGRRGSAHPQSRTARAPHP